ncbi:MAG: hypothetical protein P9F19_08985 [Candidatus Contendobacter sp.]|nr:hypothetical protein [Candidatus Contendobacter sp.]MDG4557509.1 hypothetical protein [Candidatus Contendobacter sp.]
MLLLATVLVGWSGVSQGGGFNGPQSTVSVEITADKTTLPVNIFGVGPSTSNAYTATVYVTVRRNGGISASPSVSIAVVQGLSSGALYYLDGDPEHETCTTDSAGVETCVPNAYRTVVFEDTPGDVSAHFLSSGTPGTVVLRATAQDPSTGRTISDDLTINVSAVGSAPSSVKFVMDPSPVYIRDNPLGTTPVTQNTVKSFDVLVLDDGGFAVGAGAGNNNLRVEMLQNRPNGGEWLSTVDVQGNPQEGIRVLTGTVGGVASLTLHSGTLPGTVLISATADRADNNVDNGIQRGITNYAMVSIGTGEIKSLTFTGPFADAVFVGANNLIAIPGATCGGTALCDTVWNGLYNRTISVIASDPYGNPPPAGTPITFRLIDSPLDMLQNRYPDQGHGQFAITGTTGDPQEGGSEFFAPNRKTKRTASDTLSPFVVPNGVSLAVANPLCLLMLQDPEVINPNPSTINALPSEGRLEYHVGSRIIIGRPGNNTLTVNTPFNQVSQNVGANVWYTVGCPPHKGTIMNFDTTETVVLTDQFGAASTIMSYPANQVGRRFMVAAESDGGKAGAVMTHWYLGMPNGILTITQPASLVAALGEFFFAINPDLLPINIPNWPARVQVTQTVNPGTAVSLPVTLQVLDGGVCKAQLEGECVQLSRTPVPGVPIAVDIVINDPAEAAAVAAEEALAQAQAAYDAFVGANPGVCDLVLKDPEGEPEERDPEKCTKQKELATALDEAKIAAAETRALANLHAPTASIAPETLASVGGGYARAILNVNDLPTDGSVDFFFSTVGPDVSSQALQISICGPQSSTLPCVPVETP